MDYNDYLVGWTRDHFWIQGKMNLIETLIKKAALGKNLKILNVGVGTGDDLALLKKMGKIYVIDVNSKALDLISDNIIEEKKIGDICSIPYDDKYFDLVVMFDVLEHIKNDCLAVKQIHRVLKNKGTFIFTVPAYNFLYSYHDKVLGHFRRYNKKMIKKLLKDFDAKLGYWLFSLFPLAFIQRLIEKRFFRGKSMTITKKLPRFINTSIVKILKLESYLIGKGFSFPAGLTLYGICCTKNITKK